MINNVLGILVDFFNIDDWPFITNFLYFRKTLPDVNTFISSLKENKFVFNENEDKEVYRSIEDKTDFHNIIALYKISQVFKFSNIRKPPTLFI